MLPLPYSRELHCHLIPGVDDGSQSMDFSLKALEALEDFGVEKAIITPHFTNPSFLNTPDIVQPLFEDLKKQAKEKRLEIVCEDFSFEYRMDKVFDQMFSTGKLGEYDCDIRPIRGKWLLVENGWREPYSGLVELVTKLQSSGYYPILAHPERYSYYIGFRGENFHRLQDMGLQFQCNILSFSGYYGETAKELAYWMLKHNYVNFLGSDLHNQHQIEHMEKFLCSKRYAEIAEQLEDNISNDRLGK